MSENMLHVPAPPRGLGPDITLVAAADIARPLSLSSLASDVSTASASSLSTSDERASDERNHGRSQSPASTQASVSVSVSSTMSPTSSTASTTSIKRPSFNFSASQPQPFYNCAKWTADGTALVASVSDDSLSTFVLPADLLLREPVGPNNGLSAQGCVVLPEPTSAYCPSPNFALEDPFTHSVLVGCRDHPLQIRHLFPATEKTDSNDDDGDCYNGQTYPNVTQPSSVIASYKLIDAATEAYIRPASLLWPYPGTHFVAGSQNRVDYFDASMPTSAGPLLTIPTIPSRRHARKGNGIGMKGIVSSLSLPSTTALGGWLAAGTWTRWIGLYDLTRAPCAVSHWKAAGVAEAEFADNPADARQWGGGMGIAQLSWSPCGRFLVVNERAAGSLLVYDVRVTGRPLTLLVGRDAGHSMQRMACDVFPGDGQSDGFEVWAGRVDGAVLMWSGVGMHCGIAEPRVWDGGSDAPVGSAALHSSGAVLATSSGGWARAVDQKDSAQLAGVSNVGHSAVRIWSVQSAMKAEEETMEVPEPSQDIGTSEKVLLDTAQRIPLL